MGRPICVGHVDLDERESPVLDAADVLWTVLACKIRTVMLDTGSDSR